MTEPFAGDSPSGEHSERALAGRQRYEARRRPGVWLLYTAAAMLVALVVVRNADTLDHAVRNIITLIVSFVGLMCLASWCARQRRWPRALRWAPLATILTLIVITAILFRIDNVSGELVPVLRPRWSPRPDQLLEQAAGKPSGSRVELPPANKNDFIQFLGAQRDNSAQPLPLEGPIEPRLHWKHKIGGGWSAFSTLGDYAYTLEQRGPDELVTCYRVSTGDLIWSHSRAARHSSILGGVGPRSTPTIDSGKVYAMGATGIFRCLDAATGKLLWEHRLQEEFGLTQAEDEGLVAWGRSGSPLVVDNLVVVPGGGAQARPPASLVAYDKRTGKKVWEGGRHQVAYASPNVCTIAGQRQIVSVNQDAITGHDIATGKVLWEHPWPGSSTSNANASQALTIGDDRVFVSKGYTGGASVFEVLRRGDKWATRTIWDITRVMKTKFTNVAILDGYAFGLSDGILECIRVKDGKRRWKSGRFGHGQMLRSGKVLIVLGEEGEVALVAADPEDYRELQRFQAIEGKTWNNPAINRDCLLLVRNGEEAACYELLPAQPGPTDAVPKAAAQAANPPK